MQKVAEGIKYKILLFGITKDIVGRPEITIDKPEGIAVEELLESLKLQFPGLKKLKSLMVAVNNEYAEKSQKLFERDEIALIPPVSGG